MKAASEPGPMPGGTRTLTWPGGTGAADVDVTGVLDLVVGGGALRPAPLLGNRNVTRRRERPCEIFPVPLGSRDAPRCRQRLRQISSSPAPAVGLPASGAAPPQSHAVMRACRRSGSAVATRCPASLQIPASLQFLRPAETRRRRRRDRRRRRSAARSRSARSISARCVRSFAHVTAGSQGTGSRPARASPAFGADQFQLEICAPRDQASARVEALAARGRMDDGRASAMSANAASAAWPRGSVGRAAAGGATTAGGDGGAKAAARPRRRRHPAARRAGPQIRLLAPPGPRRHLRRCT